MVNYKIKLFAYGLLASGLELLYRTHYNCLTENKKRNEDIYNETINEKELNERTLKLYKDFITDNNLKNDYDTYMKTYRDPYNRRGRGLPITLWW